MHGSRLALLAVLAIACSRTGMPPGTDATPANTTPADTATVTDTTVADWPMATPVDTLRASDVRAILPYSLAGKTFTITASTPAPTPSATCTRNTPVDAFSLAFGDTINTVTVTWVNESPPEILHGTLSDKDKMITYQLNDAFAGGTVTLEWDQDVAVAQVTINGSGIPIIVCVRGSLLPQP